VRRLVRVLILDALLVGAIVVSAAAGHGRIAGWLAGRTGLPVGLARAAVVSGAIILSAPFWIGLIRNARLLSAALAAYAWPDVAKGQINLAAAPRRAFVLGLQLAVLLLLCAPLFAIIQPFLPPVPGAIVLSLAVVALGVGVWRGAANLQGHVQAGAQMIVQALGRPPRGARERRDDQAVLEQVGHVLPGLGVLTTVPLAPEHHAVGRTLAQLDLRGRTGSTVLAITRGSEGVIVPTGRETLLAADVLCLSGTREAIEAGRKLLVTGEP
jgi:CPA2 family monovalent cation:H+ antiporter-2